MRMPDLNTPILINTNKIQILLCPYKRKPLLLPCFMGFGYLLIHNLRIRNVSPGYIKLTLILPAETQIHTLSAGASQTQLSKLLTRNVQTSGVIWIAWPEFFIWKFFIKEEWELYITFWTSMPACSGIKVIFDKYVLWKQAFCWYCFY